MVSSSQLAKMNKSLHFPAIKIHIVEAVGLKKFQLYLKNYNFCENVKFGAIFWKVDIFCQ